MYKDKKDRAIPSIIFFSRNVSPPIRTAVRNKYRLRGGTGEEIVGRIECVRRMALIRPAIKLGLHWIGRTVCPELNGYT